VRGCLLHATQDPAERERGEPNDEHRLQRTCFDDRTRGACGIAARSQQVVAERARVIRAFARAARDIESRVAQRIAKMACGIGDALAGAVAAGTKRIE